MPRKPSLQVALRNLAIQFADGMAKAINAQLAAVPSATPRASTPARRTKKSGKQRSATLESAAVKLLGEIKRQPGLRNEELQKKLGLPSEVAGRALAKLRADQVVRAKGRLRSTTYWPSAK